MDDVILGHGYPSGENPAIGRLAPKLAKQLIEYFEIQWKDNRKARILGKDLSNRYRRRKEGEKEIRSQHVLEEYLRSIA